MLALERRPPSIETNLGFTQRGILADLELQAGDLGLRGGRNAEAEVGPS
jgi:hypothetical protein